MVLVDLDKEQLNNSNESVVDKKKYFAVQQWFAFYNEHVITEIEVIWSSIDNPSKTILKIHNE